ncbi:MAG: DivIVA domain-containing protein [Oscillospiraceae bacterium]
MTGKEILAEEFEKATMRNGYRAEQVDEFLQEVAKYVDSINEKNKDLTYKIQILAEKIEDYKKDEESIRDALLGAQKLGSSILNEAKSKAEILTRESKIAADDVLAQAKSKVDFLTKDSLQKANYEITSLKKDCEREQKHLDSIKNEVNLFRTTILKQYKNHIDMLQSIPINNNNSNIDNYSQEQKNMQSRNVQKQQPQPFHQAAAAQNVPAPQETQPASQVKQDVEDKVKTEVKAEEKNPIKADVKPIASSAAFMKTPVTRSQRTIPEFDDDLNSDVLSIVAKNAAQSTQQVNIKKVNEEKAETIVESDNDKDFKQDERQQTREFKRKYVTNISAEEIDTSKSTKTNVSPAVPYNPPENLSAQKTSFAEKFGELNFGSNNIKNK